MLGSASSDGRGRHRGFGCIIFHAEGTYVIRVCVVHVRFIRLCLVTEAVSLKVA